jgi:hypothetical protein
MAAFLFTAVPYFVGTAQDKSPRSCYTTPRKSRLRSGGAAPNFLLLGSGGREHALAWKIAASPLAEQLYLTHVSHCDANVICRKKLSCATYREWLC